MARTRQAIRALRWERGALRVLDQTALPAAERWVELTGAADTAEAIARLAVRGAPLIGIVAGYGLALEVGRDPARLDEAAALLAGARPTAANLRWAVGRVAAAARRGGPGSAVAEAEAIHAEEDAAAAALAIHGAELLAGRRRILTHCNTGALAAGGEGTALGVICELARRGEVDAVIVGCDRVAANGDVANKVGTYSHALAAAAAGIPFVVAGPTSSIDAAAPGGDDIVIEERDGDEIRHAGGALLTLPGVPVRNPAFDVTPAPLITALVTERGVAAPPDARSIAALTAPAVPA